MIFSRTPKKPEHFALQQDVLPVIYFQKKNAKQLILRYDGKQDAILITLPRFYRNKDIHNFLQAQELWLIEQRNKIAIETVADTMKLPFLDTILQIVHKEGRGLTYQENETLYIFGDKNLIGNRIKNYLKKYAKNYYQDLLEYYCQKIHHAPVSLSFQDMRSCWGNCHASKGIKINYRLLMANPAVNHYVVAHEVMHLKHANHSANFWRDLETIYPSVKQERAWLKQEGWRLHQIL